MNQVQTRYSNEAFDHLMNEQGRKNPWLAHRLGVDPSYVSKLRTGAKPLTPKLTAKIALLLGVPVSYFESDREVA